MALKINQVSPGKEFGRISGPLLTDNLLRSGINLAFDTDVMYLNVNNKFVGFNTDTPVRTLDIFGDVYSDDLIINTQADIAHFSFGGTGTLDQIANYLNENIYITPDQSTDPVITLTGIGSTNKFNFVGSELTGFTDQNIIFDPTGRLVPATIDDPVIGLLISMLVNAPVARSVVYATNVVSADIPVPDTAAPVRSIAG